MWCWPRLHSNLADGERLRAWRDAQAGRARVVIGTRLAVFTPLPELGLVVVDEEHDASFKQQDGLRYSARDLALLRAKRRAVPVVLGSATPSLESYANAARRPLHAAVRSRPVAGATLPHDPLRGHTPASACATGLSQALVEAIARALVPRRAEPGVREPARLCTCAGVLRLRLDQPVHAVLGPSGPAPEGAPPALPLLRARGAHRGAVPGCGNQDLAPAGHGTQRLESALAELFPHARVLRVDRDSTRRRHAFAAMQEDIRAQRIDILVGTQMLAKGHDFPAAHPGGRRQRRQRALQQRLPCGRAPVCAAHPGGRPGRAGRASRARS